MFEHLEDATELAHTVGLAIEQSSFEGHCLNWSVKASVWTDIIYVNILPSAMK